MKTTSFQVGDFVKSEQHEYVVIQVWCDDAGCNLMKLYRIDDMAEFSVFNEPTGHVKLVARPC